MMGSGVRIPLAAPALSLKNRSAEMAKGNARSTELQPHPQSAEVPYVAEPKLVAHLHAVLERTEAQIVLTSTWRYDPAGLFSAEHRGIPFVDITPDLPEEPRRNEILAWLRDHTGVTRYAVLDDENDELEGLPLFQPSAVTGLT
jgi:HAD domain in Swiss Army Knife RNA repair proteins